ncbi:MAG TPA: acyl-CoA reductase [Novosphingobium sp.]
MFQQPIDEKGRLLVPHVIKGEAQFGAAIEHQSRATGDIVVTPPIDLDSLVWRRHVPGPAFDTPLAEVIDFLVEVGRALDFDRNEYLQEAAAANVRCSTLGARILENCYRDLPALFAREGIEAEAEASLGPIAQADGWQRRTLPAGQIDIRAFPPRVVHILAGNAPIVPPITLIRAALSRGVHLLKMPSNDMFTATALLRTMADVGPNHPVTRSFSAAYWRGGDAAIEGHIMRSQYYDKLVVWGGDAAVRHAMQYAAPGFEIISFDPKVSISMIGADAFDTEPPTAVAERALLDIVAFNQDACSCARFQFVEGSEDQVDAYCEGLARAMRIETRYSAGEDGPIPPAEIRDELSMLGTLEPVYRVFGKPDGGGMVIRSEDPVSFNPTGKVVNVVRVPSLKDAVGHVTIATQTVGVWPPHQVVELRDALSSAGAQRIVHLGTAHLGQFGGLPHDGNLPLHRMMHWVYSDSLPEA